MKRWQYEPAADLDQSLTERLRNFPRQPDMLVYGLRSLVALVIRGLLRTWCRFEIVGEADCLRVRVSDNGRGFNAANPTRRSGLGLISMEERIRLLHGTISFQSEPSTGTVIEIKVPRAIEDK